MLNFRNRESKIYQSLVLLEKNKGPTKYFNRYSSITKYYILSILNKKIYTEKTILHPRNRHRTKYDFELLSKSCPELLPFVKLNKYKNESIDFSNPKAVKTLNKALLKKYYGINNWDIPENYLCPPIPGRADYIHYVADLLSSRNKDVIAKGKNIKVLDIGIGANCVYPIIGNFEYGWQFTGTDIDAVALKSAQEIITTNPSLSDAVKCFLQKSTTNIFIGILNPDEIFDITICNPPFHTSLTEALKGNERKRINLGLKEKGDNGLNFGGQNTELWCDGGEVGFAKRMIEQSSQYPTNCFWYTMLISKKTSLPEVYKKLRAAEVKEMKTIDMAQGQKISRIIAWTFLSKIQQNKWRLTRWQQ